MNSRKGDTVLREVFVWAKSIQYVHKRQQQWLLLSVLSSLYIAICYVYIYIILTISIPVLTRAVSNSHIVVGFQTPLTLLGFCGQSNNPHAIGPFHERIARGVGFQASQFHFHRALGHCPDFRSHKKVTWIFWSILNEEIPWQNESPTCQNAMQGANRMRFFKKVKNPAKSLAHCVLLLETLGKRQKKLERNPTVHHIDWQAIGKHISQMHGVNTTYGASWGQCDLVCALNLKSEQKQCMPACVPTVDMRQTPTKN